MSVGLVIAIKSVCLISFFASIAYFENKKSEWISTIIPMSFMSIFVGMVLWLVIYSFHDWEYKSKVGVISINDNPSNSVFTEDDTDFFIPVDMTQSLISSIAFEKGKYRVELMIPDIDRTYAGIYPNDLAKERCLKVRFLAENEPNHE